MQSTHTRFGRPVFAALSIGMWLFTAGVAQAFPGGITGHSGAVVGGVAGPTCADCHFGTSDPVVTLTGPGTLAPGATGSYVLTMQRAVVSNGFGGLNVSASSGTLSNNPAGTRITAGEITHNSPIAVPASGIIWTFSWTAPSIAGTYALYGAVASTNGSGTSGDGTAARSLDVVVTAVNQPPVARIVGPLTAVAGASVTFNGGNSSDPDGNIVAFDWNFGDGSAAAGATVTHAYTAGTYTITLTVTDNAGATNSATQTITVSPANQPQPPVANPGGPYNGTVGSPVQFDGSGSNDPDGSIVTYLWNFGDGTTAGGVAPTHAYAAAGTYAVQLTVTDDSGQTGAAQTMAVIVAVPPPPPAGDGATLYQNYCASCHGPAGRGGPDGSVVGEDAEDIAEAIVEVPAMRSLSFLTATQIRAIADYLSTVPGAGQVDDEDRAGNGKGKKDRQCRDGKRGANCQSQQRRHRD